MNKKSLGNKIEKKLEKLQKLIEKIGNHSINSDDREMWDSDYYYDLESQLEEALELLRNKKTRQELDEFGEPLILEVGICSMIDEYTNKEEEIEEDF